MERPKVVITGGAGFIGSHIADALVARTEVVAVDHLKAGKRANLEDAMKAGAVLRKLDILRGDLRPIVRRSPRRMSSFRRTAPAFIASSRFARFPAFR